MTLCGKRKCFVLYEEETPTKKSRGKKSTGKDGKDSEKKVGFWEFVDAELKIIRQQAKEHSTTPAEKKMFEAR